MKLRPQDIISYQKLYKEEFNEDISREEAYDQASKLLRYVEICNEGFQKVRKERVRTRLATLCRWPIGKFRFRIDLDF